MSKLGSQPKPYQPPKPAADPVIRCAACHTPLLMAPIGAIAGLCVGLRCIQPDVITSLRLRDFNKVMQMVLSGRMKAELEEETLIVWLTQMPPKAAQKPVGEVNAVKWFTPEQAAEEMERRAMVIGEPEGGYTVIRNGD